MKKVTEPADPLLAAGLGDRRSALQLWGGLWGTCCTPFGAMHDWPEDPTPS